MVKYINNFLIFIITIFFSATNVFGYCSEPIAPEPPGVYTKPTKPLVPFCVNEIMKTHTCDDWTLNSYNSDVDMYNNQLRSYSYDVDDYIRKLQYYVNEASEYANCEIRNLD